MEQTKKCTKCKVEKPFSEFNKKAANKDGLQSRCKTCISDCYRKNADKIAEYRRENADKNAEYRRSPAGRASMAKHRIIREFRKKACRLAETHAEAIREIYRLANDVAELSGHEVHVDHICPLKAKVFDPDFGVSLQASGLHVPWNLNPIPKAVNLRKHNNVTLAEILA